MMWMAELAALSPPRFSLCLDFIPVDTGIGATPQSIAKEASDFMRPDAGKGHQRRSQVGQDVGDGIIELRHLIVEVHVALGEVLERYASGAFGCAERGLVGPRGDQVPDQLHPRHPPQLVAKLLGGRHNLVVDHLQGDSPGPDRRLPRLVELVQRLDHAVPSLGRHGSVARERGFHSHLSVNEVVLAALASDRLVGVRDFENLDARLQQVAHQPAAVRAAALDSDPADLPVRQGLALVPHGP